MSLKSLRTRQNIIIALVVFAALCGPLALFSASRSGGDVVIPYEPSERTIAFAESIAHDFAAGNPTVLPVAAGVDPTFGHGVAGAVEPTGLTDIIFSGAYSTFVGGQRWEMVRFATELDGAHFTMSVPVSYDPAGFPMLAAYPSLVPTALARTGQNAPRPTISTDDIPTSVQERIRLWAEAYAAGDSDALQVLVTDENAPLGGSYAGIGGFNCDDRCVSIPWAYSSSTFPGYAVVRVQLGMEPIAPTGSFMSIELDLLVRGWQTDAPRVQAWGHAGAGDLLRPYINNTVNQT